jgi:diadenosine tetraphosphate (Ap4A) HIT family hydrolase
MSSGGAWADPARWTALKSEEACGVCQQGRPPDLLAELPTTWVTAGEALAGDPVPLPGYVCVVAKRHVIEPFELPPEELDAFWRDAMVAARVVCEVFRPAKMNYEIHGNTMPHLHMHLYDPYVGGPIDPWRLPFTRTSEEIERLRGALTAAAQQPDAF